MKVFDFDKTIYKRISSFEFALEAIRREPRLLMYSPIMIETVIKYFTDTLTLDEITNKLNKFTEVVTDRRELIESISLTFWNENRLRRLNKDLIKLVKEDDVICSTSPSFVVEGALNHLPTKNIITSTVDFENKEIYLNTMENKVKKIRELFPDKEIEALYTDSYSDKPLMDISKTVYLVKGKRLKKIK